MPKLFEVATDLSRKKSLDYSGFERNPNDPRTEMFPFGEKSYAHCIISKALRLRDLVEQNQSEKVLDQLVDIANYSAYFYAYLTEKSSV